MTAHQRPAYCKCAFTDPDGTFVPGEACAVHPTVVPYRGPNQKPDWDDLLRALEATTGEGFHCTERTAKLIAERLRLLQKRLGGINSLACYASKEDTDSQPAMLLKIGRVARGEEEVTWPII
jgi:hypothetical protein